MNRTVRSHFDCWLHLRLLERPRRKSSTLWLPALPVRMGETWKSEEPPEQNGSAMLEVRQVGAFRGRRCFLSPRRFWSREMNAGCRKLWSQACNLHVPADLTRIQDRTLAVAWQTRSWAASPRPSWWKGSRGSPKTQVEEN